ncbi:MAG: DNA-3-methyladenine glycosylase [Candidatus Bathyarchaeota archaeon]|nr:MAG: DNA-3-methyladenine glycosylase [Candidatus Bathyarchaeota archaeon]
MKPLLRGFYTRETLTVAEELLGKKLVRYTNNTRLVGKIVEVEAYRGSDDPGSHAYRGMTPRNRLMFGKGGFAYVYFTYGMHYCFNVVTESQNAPGAVLIRALEPLNGIETMRKNRGNKNVLDLTNGPAKLTEAMNITKKQNGLDLTRSKELFISEPKVKENFEFVPTKRIGIKVGVDKPWRFYMRDNKFVSRR